MEKNIFESSKKTASTPALTMSGGGPQRVVLYVFAEKTRDSDGLMIRCARRYLEKEGIECDHIRCVRSDRGAPRLEPEGMPYVSLSHSGGYTVCAVSNGKVGVDLQKTGSLRKETREAYLDRLLRLAQRFYHPADAAWIQTDPERRFYTVWSAKEAYVKLTGTGIDGSFETFRVIPAEGPAGPAWCCDGAYYEALPFAEDFSLCVCTERPAETETEYL